MLTICSPFPSWLIPFNFSSISIIFCQFFIWIALGGVDFHLSLILVRKANACEEETKRAAWLYHQNNQCIHVTDGITVTSLSASHLQKLRVATDCLCYITLNWK